jgi:hypothetical protein
MDAIRPHTAGSTKAAVNKSEVGTIEFPTRPDRRSDHFPGGAGISERFAAQRYRVERATMVRTESELMFRLTTSDRSSIGLGTFLRWQPSKLKTAHPEREVEANLTLKRQRLNS